jgi:hypothetical protein
MGQFARRDCEKNSGVTLREARKQWSFHEHVPNGSSEAESVV